MNTKKITLASSITAGLLLSILSFNVKAANEENVRSLTKEDAIAIANGTITLEDGTVDTLLYNKAILLPENDDDNDGIKNKDEVFIYKKGDKEYLGYYSHPRLEDSDGDGLVDSKETKENRVTWQVSDRDLAMFMRLVYEDDSYVNKVLSKKPLEQHEWLTKGSEFAMMNKELAPFWTIKQFYHKASGLDAVLLESKSNLPYYNNGATHILAIRGTQVLSLADLLTDAALAVGQDNQQSRDIKEIVNNLLDDPTIKQLNITGHSLGGYLTQRAAVEAYSHKNSYKVGKVTSFNAPKVTSTLIKNKLYYEGLESKKLALEGKIKNYVIDNDEIVGIVQNENTYAESIGSSYLGHNSRTFFLQNLNTHEQFNVGKRQDLNTSGYIDPNFKNLKFITPTSTENNKVSKDNIAQNNSDKTAVENNINDNKTSVEKENKNNNLSAQEKRKNRIVSQKRKNIEQKNKN